MALCAQQLAACDTCFLLKPVEEYARPDGRWETTCLACRNFAAHASKRPRTATDGETPQPANQQAPALNGNEGEPGAASSQVEALMRLDLFQSALRGASPEAARALMRQLLDAECRGQLSAEAAADVALAYLAQHALQPLKKEEQEPPPSAQQQQRARSPGAAAAAPASEPAAGGPAGQRSPAGAAAGAAVPAAAPAGPQQQAQPQQQMPPPVAVQPQGPRLQQPPPQLPVPVPVPPQLPVPVPVPAPPQLPQPGPGPVPGPGPGPGPAWARQQEVAIDAVPSNMLRLILEGAPERCRQRLCDMARCCRPLLGALLCAASPDALLEEGRLSREDLLGALRPPPPGQPPLPALAAVAAAAALLAAAPPGPSPQMLHLVRLLAEGHTLMAIVEAGHLAPGELRMALAGAPPEAFTDIFKAMCSSDAAGQSFLKQAMQRAMPRADYGELMRITMLAEVARTAATVTDRATLLSLLDKAFA